ncbi:PE-PPE domain-containing protein [Mycobacterium sp. 21AC1]|uniref:alpha/beta fold hydrolase n=1 Tax=[Mycobacterium] appelbergii TaxID=2939269 RepID=UPI002938DEE5|nr:alpha/beta fold hydrolase [Mycobacterium sp. 21AC1]MDV3125646.1 PE-PPE domain-containing protein [Mycobacterium sp. 21AC1]
MWQLPITEEQSEMVKCRKQLVPTIAAASLLLTLGALSNGVGHAEEAVLIPGATVFKAINPFYSMIATSYPDIGIHFHEDADPRLVDYSQNALASDRALLDGVKQATIAVHEVDGKVVIIGESMGSMVAWRVAAELANGPDALPKDDVRVILIAPPEVGVAEYFKEGTYIPVLNYRVTRIVDSPYPTTIVIGEYDGWADPPDRPWNLISSANAALGIAYIHGPPISATDPDAVPAENTTTHTNTAGGIVTTHFVPAENLPLTRPFRDLGVPDALVDKADEVLRPVVDAGYVRHDRPGDARPYLHDGEIHRNVQNQQQIRKPLRERIEKARDAGKERREHRGELHRAIRKELRDRVEAGLAPFKKKMAERQKPEPSAVS